MKKKLVEKANELQQFLESLDVKIEENKLAPAFEAFQLLQEKKIADAVAPIEVKMEEYQKSNYSLKAQLEEAKQMRTDFDAIFEKKIAQINEIKVPDLSALEKLIENKITSQIKVFTQVFEKFNELEKKLNEKLEFTKLIEDVKKINQLGTLFDTYKKDLSSLIVEGESNTIKTLKEELTVSNQALVAAEKNLSKLAEDLKAEKESTEITMLLENSNLDKEEKAFLYNLHEKVGLAETKANIDKFISIKEKRQTNQRPIIKEQQRVGIKPATNAGLLRTNPINESAKMNEMDEWCELAKVVKK
jgi:hypothetical protein